MVIMMSHNERKIKVVGGLDDVNKLDKNGTSTMNSAWVPSQKTHQNRIIRSEAKMCFVVNAFLNNLCFCFFIKYIITQKGNAEIAGGGYDHFEECVLKIKQKTFTSRTAQLCLPSKPVKVVRN